MQKHASDLREALRTQNQNVPNFQVDPNTFQAEQLRFMRQHNEILEKSQQEIENEKADKLSESVREIEAKKTAAISRAENKCAAIVRDGEALSEKANKVDIESWKNESELSVSRAMREIKHWEEDLEKIITLKRELDDIRHASHFSIDSFQILAW